jgi:hypothetical protein
MKTLMRLVVGLALVGGPVTWADESTQSGIQQALSQSPAAELPAKAAEVVKSARTRDRGFITVNVVKACIRINPVCTTPVVGAIARAVPDMASISAGAAAEEQPSKATELAKAAAAGAPSRAGRIVAAVCRAVPKQYREVALGVAQVAPGSGPEVLRAVASVFPDLKGGIDHALANTQGATPSLSSVLDPPRETVTAVPDNRSPALAKSIGTPVAAGSPFSSSPTFAAPAAPSGSPDDLNPKSPSRGGRNYSAP